MTNNRDKENAWAVIPIRSLKEGKTRLASALEASAREHLNREFLSHTLTVTNAVPLLKGVLVVSADMAALDLAREQGAHALIESPPRGLNPALTMASSWLAKRGANHVMSVSADLPYLTTEDLMAVLDLALGKDGTARAAVTIAPDEDEQGTNVMVVSPPGVLLYQYGIDSFGRHRAQARKNGMLVHVIRRPGLLFDVDSPEDLVKWRDATGAASQLNDRTSEPHAVGAR